MTSEAKKIVVVEDNPFNMELVCDILAIKGYDIYEAVDAEQGLELISRVMPDLVLMDIQLPGMDGIEATKILKSQESTKNIPVVAVTANAMKGDREEIISEGFDDYISKPIEISVLTGTVEEMLKKS